MIHILRWLVRLWLRSGAVRSLLIVVFFFCFTLHFLSVSKTAETAADYEDDTLVKTADEENIEVEMPPEAARWSGNEGSPPHSDDPTLGPHGDWLEVEGSNRNVFVYSAYLDRRGTLNVVRIIAIIKKRTKVKECVVWAGNSTQRVTAKSQNIKENWNLAYSAGFVLCYLTDPTTVPTRVAVVANGVAAEGSSLPVQDLTMREPQGNMSVCVKAFHYNFDRAVWLVEFIEFYRLLGADKFIFYNHTIGSNVEAVLRYYRELGLATVLPWSLPVVTQVEIRTEGIFAALNDCNLRSVNRFPLAAMVDVDEFLVPRRHPSLLHLVHSYRSTDHAFIFQNVFFYLYWENDTAVNDVLFGNDQGLGPALFGSQAAMPYLLTASKTRRLAKPHKHGVRSKYIVRPEAVVELGNHNVWEYVGTQPQIKSTKGREKFIGRTSTARSGYGAGTRRVTSGYGAGSYTTPRQSQTKGVRRARPIPADVGLSHHYRICEFGGFDCLKQSNLVDRTAHNWLEPLYTHVASACTHIFPSLGMCPAAPPLGSPW
ncbi:beta-1,4-galactosyltransferase galt-1 isoform X2 [Procambarus clarkii]|uniref:beta-1,4-galactosyltransferase galt-1 isoform X2 n=1 Tax=Procambarus clarkii TaxID=6728 RepID=UPI001E6723A0|nr:beta-1,4-galactosyltransferase galt-1-like isoform X2 [Procambarus clarkii]